MGFRDQSKGTIAHGIFRLVQMAAALTVVGLYAQDLIKPANKPVKFDNQKWLFAVATSATAAVTAFACIFPFTKRIPFLFVWETILWIAWIALFGMFAMMYLKETVDLRMKNAVWVDLGNAGLWLCSALGMVWYWHKNRRGSSGYGGQDYGGQDYGGQDQGYAEPGFQEPQHYGP